MAMDEPVAPTPGELEILKVLWEQGPASVKQVHEALARERDVAYNTVQTLLRIMEEKKKLVRHHAAGRTFIYTPCYSRDDSMRGFLERVFDGAAADMVQSLLRSERISGEELERMQKMLAEARRRQSKR
jgi:BlaI family penicillinase repressor